MAKKRKRRRKSKSLLEFRAPEKGDTAAGWVEEHRDLVFETMKEQVGYRPNHFSAYAGGLYVGLVTNSSSGSANAYAKKLAVGVEAYAAADQVVADWRQTN